MLNDGVIDRIYNLSKIIGETYGTEQTTQNGIDHRARLCAFLCVHVRLFHRRQESFDEHSLGTHGHFFLHQEYSAVQENQR